MIEVTEGGNILFLIFPQQAHWWHSNGTADFVLRISKLKTEIFFYYSISLSGVEWITLLTAAT